MATWIEARRRRPRLKPRNPLYLTAPTTYLSGTGAEPLPRTCHLAPDPWIDRHALGTRSGSDPFGLRCASKPNRVARHGPLRQPLWIDRRELVALQGSELRYPRVGLRHDYDRRASSRASSVRERTPSLPKTRERCPSTVRSERKSAAATSLFVLPSATRAAIRASAGVSAPGAGARPLTRLSSARARSAHRAVRRL